MFQQIRFPLYCLLLCVLLNSCSKRYWYRVKINDFRRKFIPVNIIIVNHSPAKLSVAFEKGVREACEKQLRKGGFKQATKETPIYEFVLSLKVDTFRTSGITNYQSGSVRMGNGLNYVYYPYTGTSPAILFDCEMICLSPERIRLWSASNDLYFLCLPGRDLMRSRGMVKYMIRTAGRRK